MNIMNPHQPRTATLYRMVLQDHLCPYGLKAKDLLQREGFEVEDKWLTSRAEIDAFKAEQDVKTTPQVFIAGERIGGYDDLRRHFGKSVADPNATSYKPVIALFAMTALMALAASIAAYGTPFTLRAAEWFAVPLTWDELASVLSAGAFDIRTVLERLEMPCPLQSTTRRAVTLDNKVLKRLEKHLVG